MEYQIKTTYDRKALTVMARTLRKTLRSRRSRIVHVFGWLAVALALLVLLARGLIGELSFDGPTVVTVTSAVIVFLALIKEDTINGWAAGRQMLPNMRETLTAFESGTYASMTDAAQTIWKYTQIQGVYETADYFVFFLSARHGQIYDKAGFEEGTPDGFRTFIAEKTGKQPVFVK